MSCKLRGVLDRRQGLKASWRPLDVRTQCSLNERVTATCHKLGRMSSNGWWRYGGLFVNHAHRGGEQLVWSHNQSSLTLTAPTPGQTEEDVKSSRFAPSAMLHVTRAFLEAS